MEIETAAGRRWTLVAGVVLVLALAWFIATEAGAPAGGLSRHDAVSQAMQDVDSSTPLTERASTPGPFLLLGWGINYAVPFYRMVWAVGLAGTFPGHCTPSEANACFPVKTVVVIIDYFSGKLISLRYGS